MPSLRDEHAGNFVVRPGRLGPENRRLARRGGRVSGQRCPRPGARDGAAPGAPCRAIPGDRPDGAAPRSDGVERERRRARAGEDDAGILLTVVARDCASGAPRRAIEALVLEGVGERPPDRMNVGRQHLEDGPVVDPLRGFVREHVGDGAPGGARPESPLHVVRVRLRGGVVPEREHASTEQRGDGARVDDIGNVGEERIRAPRVAPGGPVVGLDGPPRERVVDVPAPLVDPSGQVRYDAVRPDAGGRTVGVYQIARRLQVRADQSRRVVGNRGARDDRARVGMVARGRAHVVAERDVNDVVPRDIGIRHAEVSPLVRVRIREREGCPVAPVAEVGRVARLEERRVGRVDGEEPPGVGVHRVDDVCLHREACRGGDGPAGGQDCDPRPDRRSSRRGARHRAARLSGARRRAAHRPGASRRASRPPGARCRAAHRPGASRRASRPPGARCRARRPLGARRRVARHLDVSCRRDRRRPARRSNAHARCRPRHLASPPIVR